MNFLKYYFEDYEIKNANNIKDMFKDLLQKDIQTTLEYKNLT